MFLGSPGELTAQPRAEKALRRLQGVDWPGWLIGTPVGACSFLPVSYFCRAQAAASWMRMEEPKDTDVDAVLQGLWDQIARVREQVEQARAEALGRLTPANTQPSGQHGDADAPPQG